MKTDPTDDLILRPARASDIPRIETLHLITFEDHRRRETGFDQTPFIDEFTAAIGAASSRASSHGPSSEATGRAGRSP
jgi:hypothetical protein